MAIPADGGDSDAADDPLAGLKADLKAMAGGLALVETTSAGWGEGKAQAPQWDWQARRVGANPPASLVDLRQDVENSIVAACGVPVSLYAAAADAAGQREAWRRFLHGPLAPLGMRVAEELAVKLDAPELSLNFDRLFASDLSGRARAFGSMVKAGREIETAMALAGLDEG